MGIVNWERAGFAHESTGRLGKPVRASALILHRDVRVVGDALAWDRLADKMATPGPGMLDDFVRLWELEPGAIIQYAKRWGVLRIEDRQLCARSWQTDGTEPIAAWRFLSRRACAVLNIAAALQEGKLPTDDDLEQIASKAIPKGAIPDPSFTAHCPVADFEYFSWDWLNQGNKATRLKLVRGALQFELNQWLDAGRPARGRSDFAIWWNHKLGPKGQWEIIVTNGGFLFPALALQLVLTVARASGLYSCSGCGRPYMRIAKQPKPGQANFCDQCGRDEALRQADRRRQEKMREARRLHGEGLSLAKIADALSTTSATVRGWIGKGKSSAKTTRTR